MKKIIVIALALLFSTSSEAKKIGILSALPKEQAELKTKIVNGKIGKHDVVLSLSGMGKVNAAATAQRLISEDKVEILLFTGVAGGINPKYNIGDVVFISRAFQHDVGMLTDTFTVHPPGVLPEFGIGTGKESLYFNLRETNSRFFDNAMKIAKKFPQKKFDPVTVDQKDYHPKLYLNGTVATGDQFIANQSKKDALRVMEADVVEMEGAAVAQVAHQNKIPCLIIRSVSDKAGGKADVDFAKLSAQVANNNSDLVEFLLQNDNLTK